MTNVSVSVVREKAPTEPLPRSNLASILVRRNEIDEAELHYEKALEHNPEYAKAHFNLGTLLARKGQDARAVGHYSKAIEKTPNSVEIRFNLGQALRRLGRFDAAIPHYQFVATHDAARDTARACEVYCLVAQGQWKQAIEKNAQHCRDLPRSALLAHSMARLLAACPDETLRRSKTAMTLAKRVREAFASQNKLSAEHVQTHAMALAATGNFDQAMVEQRRMIDYLKQQGGRTAAVKIRHFQHIKLTCIGCEVPSRR